MPTHGRTLDWLATCSGVARRFALPGFRSSRTGVRTRPEPQPGEESSSRNDDLNPRWRGEQQNRL